MPSIDTARAIKRVLQEQRPRMISFVKKMARELEPDDVVQTASEKALTRSNLLRDPARAEAWVMRIVRNTLLDELRKKRANTVPFEENNSPTEEETEPPCWCVLSQSTQIKPAYREILKKVDLEETPISQVAVELGLTNNNVMVRLHRARQALKQQVALHCGTTTQRSCADCGCESRGCCPPPKDI